MQQTIVILVAAYFTWMIYTGWQSSRHKDAAKENFLIGNRNITALLVAIGTTMGWVDAVNFGFSTGLVYDNGWSGLTLWMGVPIAFGLLAIFAGRIRHNAAEDGAYMMGNYFSKTFSPRVAATVGFAVWIYFFLWGVIQFLVGGQVIAALSGIPYTWVILSMGLVTLAYMLMGGFLASIRTDLIQFLIFAVFMIAMIILWGPKAGVWAAPAATFGTMPWVNQLSLLVMGMCSTFAAPDVWQRIYSAKTAKDARRSVLIMTVMMFVVLVLLSSLGMVVKGMGIVTDSNHVAAAIFLNLVPSWLLPLALLAFVAAIMSTIATTTFGGAMCLVSDVAYELKWVPHRQIPVACRWTMGAMLAAGLSIALFQVDLTDITLACFGVCLVFTPLVGVSLLGLKFSECAVFYSLAISLIAFLIGAWFNIYSGPMALLPLAVATGTLLIFQAILPKKRA